MTASTRREQIKIMKFKTKTQTQLNQYMARTMGWRARIFRPIPLIVSQRRANIEHQRVSPYFDSTTISETTPKRKVLVSVFLCVCLCVLLFCFVLFVWFDVPLPVLFFKINCNHITSLHEHVCRTRWCVYRSTTIFMSNTCWLGCCVCVCFCVFVSELPQHEIRCCIPEWTLETNLDLERLMLKTNKWCCTRRSQGCHSFPTYTLVIRLPHGVDH